MVGAVVAVGNAVKLLARPFALAAAVVFVEIDFYVVVVVATGDHNVVKEAVVCVDI